MAEIKYRKLSANDTSRLRCDYLMYNKMQCPTHAAVELVNVGKDSVQHPCVFHFNQLVTEDNGLTFAEAE